jgi:hypothetical protein
MDANSVIRGDGLSDFFRQGCFGMLRVSYCLYSNFYVSVIGNLCAMGGWMNLNTSLTLESPSGTKSSI